MKGIGLVLLICLASMPATAAKMMNLADYSAVIKERVIAKIGEALALDKEASISGTVTFSSDGEFFIQRDEDGLKIKKAKSATETEVPMVGDVVEVHGKPSLEGGRVIFVASSWEVEKKAKKRGLKPVKLDAADLLGGRAGERANWCRVELIGRVMGRTDVGFVLKVGEAPVAVRCAREIGKQMEGCEVTHPQIRVCGVLELVLDQSVLAGESEQVEGIRLNVASKDDITLMPDAQYLMAVRDRRLKRIALAALVVLTLGLIGFAAIVLKQCKDMYDTRAVMAERKRMADDLHDTIEQYLVGAGMLVKLGRAKEAERVLVQAKREIRDIVWGLKSDDMMRLKPAEMLRQLAHEENCKGLYRVDTQLTALPEKMDASAMRDLCLIVREAIGNAVKHGRARHIAIASERSGNDGGWILRIGNDGEQFEPASAKGTSEGHFGLEGMRERARRLGAEFKIAKRKNGMVVELTRRK